MIEIKENYDIGFPDEPLDFVYGFITKESDTCQKHFYVVGDKNVIIDLTDFNHKQYAYDSNCGSVISFAKVNLVGEDVIRVFDDKTDFKITVEYSPIKC